MNPFQTRFIPATILLGLLFLACSLVFVLSMACSFGFRAWSVPTPTATLPKTPTLLFTPTSTSTSTSTPLPTPTNTALPPTSTPLPPTASPEPPTNTPVPVSPTPQPPISPTETSTNTAEVTPTDEIATTEPVLQEDTAYKIVHYKVLGESENNGGIFNKGGQHFIFLTVLDENGQGVDGAVVKDANGSSLEVVTGSKGPGKAEILMEWEPYRLYVVADPNGPTTSETSNQMNTAFPYIPDIVGKLGSIDNEYSVCPTLEIRCTPPFYSVHFSYEIIFQKIK